MLTSAAEGQSPAPFSGWHEMEGVSTSNDDYSVDVHWSPTAGRMRIPGFDPPVEVGTPGLDGLLPRFAVELRCRADGSAEGYAGPGDWEAILIAPYPPQAENVYNWWYPMYWILGLAGRAEHRTPVEIRFEGRPVFASVLKLPLIHYSAVRPNQTLDLSPREVWSNMRSGLATVLHGTGKALEIELHFPPRGEIPLLDLMFWHCPEITR